MAQAERDDFERLDHLTADVIHLFRRCKMTPARAGSAGQFMAGPEREVAE